VIIVGVNRSHNGSVVLMKDNEIIFHIENERLSNIKYDFFIFQALSMINKYVDHIDILALAGLHPLVEYDSKKKFDIYSSIVLSLGKTFLDHGFKLYDFWSSHHQMHAACAFYNSGFESALCLIKDGAGSEVHLSYEGNSVVGRESSTLFSFSYPNLVQTIKKHITVPEHTDGKIFLDKDIFVANSYSEGAAFEQTALSFGFTVYDAGKIMGMSAYGNHSDWESKIYDKDGLVNKEIFSFNNSNLSDFNFKAKIKNNFEDQSNFAFALQKSVEENVAKEIVSILKEHEEKNLCLSGGFFLNCVSNYNLLKYLPDDINLYVEPISSDAGTAIGAAKTAYYIESQSFEIKKQKNIFYGPKYQYSLDDISGEKIIFVSPGDIAKILSEKNIVAMYQGRSESGPRALGNRSILYDPRDKGGKDRVNLVKKREWFRPFAGSVLEEYANEWFDLKQLKDSKFMMFAVDVLEEKKELIPAITHIDGSCRVQTVEKEDNKNFYTLIEEFYKITGVPVVLNTSLNLAGECIVETIKDAVNVLKKSEIDYLYLPELGVLVEK
jgi:carbamoyltransferase